MENNSKNMVTLRVYEKMNTAIKNRQVFLFCNIDSSLCQLCRKSLCVVVYFDWKLINITKRKHQVYVAEADGVPEYNGAITSEKRLVAVKFLCHDATLKERYIMYEP